MENFFGSGKWDEEVDWDKKWDEELKGEIKIVMKGEMKR